MTGPSKRPKTNVWKMSFWKRVFESKKSRIVWVISQAWSRIILMKLCNKEGNSQTKLNNLILQEFLWNSYCILLSSSNEPFVNVVNGLNQPLIYFYTFDHYFENIFQIKILNFIHTNEDQNKACLGPVHKLFTYSKKKKLFVTYFTRAVPWWKCTWGTT